MCNKKCPFTEQIDFGDPLTKKIISKSGKKSNGSIKHQMELPKQMEEIILEKRAQRSMPANELYQTEVIT